MKPVLSTLGSNAYALEAQIACVPGLRFELADLGERETSTALLHIHVCTPA